MRDFDVLIIGGGATGGGTALDLALRGLRVALIERSDLTDGTSGRYHGLLHSGGRYAVRDPESAAECIVENRILRKIVPHAIEDTGGFFVQTPDDDPAYADKWIVACRECGIETEEISVGQMLKEEPALNPRITRVFRVPDASCDSFDVLTALGAAVSVLGGTVLTYHEIVGLTMAVGKVTGVTIHSKRTGEEKRLGATLVVNAAGAWAGQIAAMAGCPLTVRPSKGTMIAMAYRFVNTILNRLHTPGDGDILVPVGTVTVIGTTSVNVLDPNETGVEPWEVQLMLREGEKLVPGFSQARALRAWAGVRPLYEEGKSIEGREAKRTFAVLDHATRDGVGGLVTVVGGKFTTYRLMAERAADIVCAHLGVTRPCTTKTFRISDFGFRIPDAGSTHGDVAIPNPQSAIRNHTLGHRLEQIEAAPTQSQLICECEIVTRQNIEAAAHNHPDVAAMWVLDDLRRDLRLGMGPCQGGFCGYRAAGILHEMGHQDAAQATAALADFAQRRWKGQRSVLWGAGLRQALLDEQIYRGILGLTWLGPTA
jgi:glycerol-3-phosphate dehydrogenase